ncbi:MAG: HAMP domain-containing protein [Anaerolineales bacterium]|nr:HAMP domain-containing protein [Anaerolineales bacterium]
MSIRFKVILPYLLLTLVVAVTGVYVVTKLVANTLNERLVNQLLEAGRVVSDDFARQEIKHVETARIVAYTTGLAEAVLNGDKEEVASLAMPVADGLGVENLVVIDANGQEVLHLLRDSEGKLEQVKQYTGAPDSAIVQSLLALDRAESPPRRGLGINLVDDRYYYYTVLPIPLNGRFAGIVMIGSSLNTILPYLKTTSLADVIVYADDGRAIAATLPGGNTLDVDTLSTLSISETDFQEILRSDGLIRGENFSMDGRWYSLVRSPLEVGGDRLGVYAVILPLNYVVQSSAVSRNTYILLFGLAMAGVIMIGYFISRLIINPLHSLVTTSRAIAGGELERRTGIQSSDEIGFLASTFDEMTERLHQRTLELEKTNRVLEQLDRAKVKFIQISAHELRTPLTLILGYAQLLKLKTQDDAEYSGHVASIIEGARGMTEIVNNMLDVSRIDNRTLNLSPTTVYIDSLVDTVLSKIKPVCEERHIDVCTEALKALPPLTADPDLLQKVFYHIVTNAVKYTPDGGKIQISGRVIEEPSGHKKVEIATRDTGIGIEPQYQELIFQKFFQTGEVLLHSSGKTKFKGGGPGLGLAIAQGIVEAHQGRLWVESPGYDETKNPGSTFYVQLPLSTNGNGHK